MKIYNAKWTSTSAGPSPYNNYRTEIFLYGCNRAIMGEPCKNCFNPSLWDSSKCMKEYSPLEVATQIIKYSPNKYVTFVGGEPLDQAEELGEVCSILKKFNYHIIVFSSYALNDKSNSYKFNHILPYVDIIIDGKYDESERIYREDFGDGFTDAIGSGNQIVWDINQQSKEIKGFYARDLSGIYVSKNNSLKFITKNNQVVEQTYQYNKKIAC